MTDMEKTPAEENLGEATESVAEMQNVAEVPAQEQISAAEVAAANDTDADDVAKQLNDEEAEQDGMVREKINALPVTYRRKPVYDFFKRLIDFILSIPAMLLFIIAFIFIAPAILIDNPGPIFYKHKRVGKNGKVVYIHKFRTMKKNADQLATQLTPEQLHQYYTEFKVDNDPRITKVGNFLRRTSLDELPQILDIFIGRLSIVGPRPVVEVELERYYDKRDTFLSVKPGLTGYWQAYARNDVTYMDGARQEMELHYVDKRSLWFDIKIFFKTIISVFQRKGAK